MINLSKPLIPKAVGGSAINPYGVAFATGGGQAWGLGGFPSQQANPDLLNKPNYALGNASVAQIGANTLNRLGSEWMGGFPTPQAQPLAPITNPVTSMNPNPVASSSGSPTAPASNAFQRWQGGQPAPMTRAESELGQQQINDERAASRYKGRSAPGAPMARTEYNIGRVAGVRFNNSASNWTAY